jgi:hypothetical protein
MPAKSLHELLSELEVNLRSGEPISDRDRELLDKLHADLSSAVKAHPAQPPAHLKPTVRDAIDQLSVKHPRLSSLLSATLDALSDLGV